mmetsp:Transcript_19762/g.37178  ORF Transcript_19762/g.37178 Transcript_19762/m.37178 type:complete len:234 (-) Transcript_19762:209-910(-)
MLRILGGNCRQKAIRFLRGGHNGLRKWSRQHALHQLYEAQDGSPQKGRWNQNNCTAASNQNAFRSHILLNEGEEFPHMPQCRHGGCPACICLDEEHHLWPLGQIEHDAPHLLHRVFQGGVINWRFTDHQIEVSHLALLAVVNVHKCHLQGKRGWDSIISRHHVSQMEWAVPSHPHPSGRRWLSLKWRTIARVLGGAENVPGTLGLVLQHPAVATTVGNTADNESVLAILLVKI